MIISQHKSLAEIYAELCIRLREIQREMASGEAACRFCSGRRSSHLPDGRCSSLAGSRTFVAGSYAEGSEIERALVLIEELQLIKV